MRREFAETIQLCETLASEKVMLGDLVLRLNYLRVSISKAN